jgi:NDP-sugar pyrophosphorylase family protein
MKGVIFAAGLGTRLYPLTKDKPKALVEVQGQTMLGHTLDKMVSAGIREIIINVHAFADKVEACIHDYALDHPEIRLHVSDERDLLLETGGGLKKMQHFLDEPFIVHNVDVLSTIDLNKEFNEEKTLAVLAVRRTIRARCFLFNEEGLLCGWENIQTGEQKIARPNEKNLQRFGFTGIHRISPVLFPLMTEEGVFSITDVYLRLAQTHDIRMVDVSDADWYDIGSPEQLAEAEKNFKG